MKHGRANPLQQTLYQLFHRLDKVHGLLFFLQSQMKVSRKRIDEFLANPDVPKNAFVTSSRLAIRDLTEWPSHGWAIHYPTPGFTSRDRKHIATLDLVFARNAGWTISLSFEAFESYLKEILAHALFANHRLFDNARVRKIKNAATTSTVENWRQAVATVCTTNRKLLSLVKSLAPSLDQAENSNNRSLPLREWFAVVTEVRHAITHSDFIVKSGRIENWTECRRKLLEGHFSAALMSDGYCLCPTWDNAKQATTLFAEYGFAIFKALSIVTGEQWRIYDEQKAPPQNSKQR